MKMVLLVIEDNEVDRELIGSALKKVPNVAKVMLVEDGAEGISYLMGDGPYADRSEYPYPSLILIDLKMPRVDGFEVLSFLKNNSAWSIIPTIVLTASADPDDVKKAYMLGASSYRVKPHSYDELLRFFLIMAEYWQTCSIPEVDETGKRVPTTSAGKLGERYSDEVEQAPVSPRRSVDP